MRLKISHTIKNSVITTAALLLAATAYAGQAETLITDGNQLSARTQLGDLRPSNLIDGDLNTQYHSWDEKDVDSKQYFQVKLNSALSLENGDDLVFYLRRCPGCNDRCPTAFRVEGNLSEDANEESWETFCHIYFPFRGVGTKEFSERVHTDKTYRHLRFTVIANNSHSEKNGHYVMGMSEFQIYKISRSEDYSEISTLSGVSDEDKFRDRFHLKKDYNYTYRDYTFVNTRGITDPRNRNAGVTTQDLPKSGRREGINHEAFDKANSGDNTQEAVINRLKAWCDWDNAWKDGIWQYDRPYLRKYGVNMPEYTLVTEDKDLPPDNLSQKRQPAHVVEHILYAMPGDVIPLYPYYELAAAKHGEQYQFNFVHWYDYRTGGHLKYDDGSGNTADMLDFLIDPYGICYSDDYGFYGGYKITDGIDTATGVHKTPGIDSENYGMVATFFCPRNPITNDAGLTFDRASGENDVDEFVIAADFAQEFNMGRNVNSDAKQIVEPEVSVRHLFRIRDGKTFADEFSGSPDKNSAYVAKHRRHISARAGQQFQTRLELPIPTPVEHGWLTQSNYYYKKSATAYQRVEAVRIRVIDPQTRQPIDNPGFVLSDEFKGLGIRSIDGTSYELCGGEKGYYNRMLRCDNPGEGRYRVQLIGQECKMNNDTGGIQTNDIYVYGSDNLLVVAEFDIEFLPEDKAYMKKDTEVSRTLDNDFRESYGDPKASVDFDRYRFLESLENKKQYLDGDGIKYRYKWPAFWDQSNYCFGYGEGHDYNMYLIASHNSKVPYSQVSTDPGLYDRRYYDTNGEEHGYFFYANASSDPGVMARLDVDQLCTGSTLHVSAWVAELSESSESANISLNLVAVLKNTEERINLHSFVSGYVASRGVWHNIYYRVGADEISNAYTSDQIDHYELELENNCKSSEGADYIIDNINIYIVSPVVYAEHLNPVCDDKENAVIRLDVPFEETLQSIGLEEAASGEGTNVSLYYTVIDKEKFDKIYEEHRSDENPGAIAYEAAMLQNPESSGKGYYGVVTFNTNYESNNPYNKDNIEAAGKNTTGKVKIISFNIAPQDDNVSVGKEYYISFAVKDSAEDFIPGWTDFDIKDLCSKSGIFKVSSKNKIVIDGEVRESSDYISVCENQSPVVSVNLYETGANDGSYYQNAQFDWFAGSKEDYEKATHNGVKLSDAMVYFRNTYPDLAEISTATPDDATGFTQAMIDAIIYYSTGSNSPLILSAESYQFPPIQIASGKESAECVVLALPIPLSLEGNKTVCSSPTEIRIHTDTKSPLVQHGLTSGVTYPVDMYNVPLRIGLKQLKKEVVIPLRTVRKSGVIKDVTDMEFDGNAVELVSTDDPAYENAMHIETYATASGESYSLTEGISAGQITDLSANVNTKQNTVTVRFSDNFTFREGYSYDFKFKYKEVIPDSEAVLTDNLCGGADIFTIKVVPEYVMWNGTNDTGSVGGNWNNDNNWRRVTYDDLMVADDDKSGMKDFVTDGTTNDNMAAFMPLDFTKVIIPRESRARVFPYLYRQEESAPKSVGPATDNIQYDMVAYDSQENNAEVWCRLWYANTCKEIHFMPDSEIMNQQFLNYQRAWVDLELDPYRWYTLSMPFSEVFAGEMYLPTATGRQNTQLYKPIVYNEELNDRFNPAVFQRGWDKGEAKIYNIGNRDGDVTTAAVRANWSHVYNDVEEKYGSGVGFSIKAYASISEGTTAESESSKVMFRLPKADTEYYYYNQDGTIKGDHTKNVVHSDELHYRLNPSSGKIKATAAGGNYFLVGNPFMSHLDVKKFLEENSDKVEPKYWLVTSGSQKAAVFSPDGTIAGDASTTVAPMQGFFVEAKENVATTEGSVHALELAYDENMMCSGSFSGDTGSPLKAPVLSPPSIVVNAINEGWVSSSASIVYDVTANNGYDSYEDLALLDNSDLEISSSVYTVADGRALFVNRINDFDKTEIGVIALPEEKTLLQFECRGFRPSVYLYDMLVGKSMEIADTLEYEVSGPCSGRLFIMADKAGVPVVSMGLTYEIVGDELVVRSENKSSIKADIYDIAGRHLDNGLNDSGELRFRLAPGIYVLRAEDGVNIICKQIKI